MLQTLVHNTLVRVLQYVSMAVGEGELVSPLLLFRAFLRSFVVGTISTSLRLPCFPWPRPEKVDGTKGNTSHIQYIQSPTKVTDVRERDSLLGLGHMNYTSQSLLFPKSKSLLGMYNIVASPRSVTAIYHILSHSPSPQKALRKCTYLLFCSYTWPPAWTPNGHYSTPFGSKHIISVLGSNTFDPSEPETRTMVDIILSRLSVDQGTMPRSSAYSMPNSGSTASAIVNSSFCLGSPLIFALSPVTSASSTKSCTTP